MSILNQEKEDAAKLRGDLLFESQQREKSRFKRNVGVSWGILFLIIVYFFSGQNFLGIKTIELNTDFIVAQIGFIAQGLPQTLLVSILAITLAMILALLAALGRLSTIPPLYALSTFYVSLIRGTPLYLQIFFFFLALPQLGIVLTGLFAGVLALGLNYGAYMSEIFRAGLASVGKGQREAAIALGMTPIQTMRRIVLPQALRFAIPPVGNEFIAMTKDSALVSATGFVHEIMWRATRVGRAQFNNLEALIMAAVFYWVMTLLLTYVQSIVEARLSKGDR
ncbi:MAG: amino acid ABC transporter permease [Anaerolineaceae bacterium]|jgi:polar amino acid transport system permease protein|nr:MAG: amino acid ABC transporter permease [Anaerolineaceae bacterium]